MSGRRREGPLTAYRAGKKRKKSQFSREREKTFSEKGKKKGIKKRTLKVALPRRKTIQ